ncbi:hypothetical protein LAWI1_G002664 [Lachnellula willkommii]|uniref:MYND-type domain-containing protein n=1 Tax=Lachnellula willkommii TaxID=215461 RepID=A0A559MGC6_9HELO|nr:hypothetical protein LAWI1_G002664 [Lachnellula willkommii]
MECSRCKLSPILEGDAPIVHYCNRDCQRADWSQHKTLCRNLQDRTTLYRVATVAQKLYYICRELTWAQYDIQSVERAENKLILHGRVSEDATWPADYKVFPSHLFPAEADRRDREATLSYRTCRDSASWMVEFVEGMLKGIVVQASDIEVRTKNNKRLTRMPLPGVWYMGDEVRHNVLKLQLRSGELFAVDLSGAQFGHHDPVTSWNEYEKTRVREVLDVDAAPSPDKILQVDDYSFQKMAFFVRKVTQPHEARRIHLDVLESMNLHFLEWQADEHLSLASLWSLGEKEFQKKHLDLVDYIEWKFHSVIQHTWYTEHGRQLAQEIKGPWVFGK